MLLAALWIGMTIAMAPGEEPRTLRDHEEVGVGYNHRAVPLESTLTRAELEEWIEILAATEPQAEAIRATFDAHIVEHHNPFVDEMVPGYLAKSAASSTSMQAHGFGSAESRTAGRARDQAARTLIDLAERLEHQFIHAIALIEPELTPEQVDSLHVLRGFATRRSAHTVATTNRWVNFELRQAWGSRHLPAHTESDRATIARKLAAYELDLTPLVVKWSRSHLDAGRRVQQYFYDSARGQLDDSRIGPAELWARPAKLTTRLRALHLRVHEELLMEVDDAIAAAARVRVSAMLYPQLYPDHEYERAASAFAAAMDAEGTTPHAQSQLGLLRAQFEDRYRRLAQELEAACAHWDDQVASGVGFARPQDLSGELAPRIEDRATLCREFVQEIEAQRAILAPPATSP